VFDFVHLHNHSDYSLLDGAAPLERLITKAKSFGMQHLSLTDHGNLFGALKFYQLCKKHGLNPIIGSEFYMAPGSRHIKTGTEAGNKYYHLVLLAKNEAGYRNLIQLSSLSYTEGFYYKPRIDQELLEQYHEGLICTSACIAGEIPALLIQGNEEEARRRAGFFQELFGKGNFYLELQDHGIPEQKIANRGILRIANQLQIGTIATNDIHYVDREDANAQDILVCIGTGKKKSEVKRLHFEATEFYMKSPEEMYRIFSEVPEALKRTLEIAEQCKLSIPLPGPQLPEYQIPPSFSSPEEYLRYLAYEGLKKRYPALTEELKKRLDYELDIIIRMKFTGYFLIVWDFIHFARERKIPVGPGRGSGAGSLVAYCLQITDIDPLKYGLLFERFLNPERISMPDFDIDFCFERRQEVIDYVTEKYGKDRVGQIITFGTLKAKAVLKDVARVLDIPFSESNEIVKWIPDEHKVTLARALEEEEKLRDLAEKGPVYKELIETSLKLEGLSRHASTHAAGIVIGKSALTDYVPLYRDPKTGTLSTQYTMEQLESCGLVKMDFLGLKTLTLIENTAALIRKRMPDFDIESIPEDDRPTFQLLGEGNSACVFQFESQGMQNILKRAKPSSINDLIALNALYRPGPMQFIDQFIDAKSGKIPVKYPLPELEPVLKETYGVIVYQEQVMEIARIVAGYSLGQADILRRAMGKKKPEEMAKQKKSFIEGAVARGLSEKKADEIFELLVPFAGYGFNKSHAAAYSILAYKTAYLKANFPAEFMAANLTNEINNTDKLAEYIAETRKLHIEILPPDINRSDKYFSVVGGKILYGLMGMKNMGSNAAEEILRARNAEGPFQSFLDFLDKVDLKIINRKVLETGIQCGLFDSLFPNRAALLTSLDTFTAFAEKKKESRSYGQASLFEGSKEEEFPEPKIEPIPDWPETEKLRFEKEILGFYFSGHPLERYRTQWEKSVTLNLQNPDRASSEKTHRLLGILRTIRPISTKTGKKMAFAVLEDFNGTIELVIFSSVLEQYEHKIKEDTILGVMGRLDLSREKPSFIVEEFKEPEDLGTKDLSEIHVLLDGTLNQEEDFYTLRSFFIEHPGSCSIYLHFRKAGNGTEEQIVRASAQLKTSGKKEIIQQLRSLPGVEDVWVS
jgi:DNA polymerase-3 subunit alpha